MGDMGVGPARAIDGGLGLGMILALLSPPKGFALLRSGAVECGGDRSVLLRYLNPW